MWCVVVVADAYRGGYGGGGGRGGFPPQFNGMLPPGYNPQGEKGSPSNSYVLKQPSLKDDTMKANIPNISAELSTVQEKICFKTAHLKTYVTKFVS